LSNRAATRSVEYFAASVIVVVRNRFGPRREIQKTTRRTFEILLTLVPEQRAMNPEFYLILNGNDLTDELANAVFEAGFDDSSLVMRGGGAAIWIRHREGEFKQVVREALEQAKRGGLDVLHVEMENEVFA
jgi:hypothetical protein